MDFAIIVKRAGRMKDRIRQDMYQAAEEYGCWCASVTLCVLGKIFDVFVDEMVLRSGIGISILR